jgi:alanine racemase
MEPIWAEVDLAAIRNNFSAIKSLVQPQTKVMAVVKANAYGHGAVPVAEELIRAGASTLAVARVEEGLELRRAKVASPILVLGLAEPEEARLAVEAELSVAVASFPLAQALSLEAQSSGKVCHLHVKVDTGMGRIGVFPQDLPAFIGRLTELPGLSVEGVFSHLATADEQDHSEAKAQLREFLELKGQLQEFKIPYFHLANSAGILNFPEAQLDLVRPGIVLYGLWPSAACSRRIKLKPALSWKSRLCFIKELPPGFGISYGHTFRTQRPTIVGTVSVGYGDGYSRLLSNRGQMLVAGRRVPIIGRVCMDQTMVDLTELVASGIEPEVGDEVVLLGRQGKEEITASELAAKMNTISYEVTCLVGRRVRRYYLNSKV